MVENTGLIANVSATKLVVCVTHLAVKAGTQLIGTEAKGRRLIEGTNNLLAGRPGHSSEPNCLLFANVTLIQGL